MTLALMRKTIGFEKKNTCNKFAHGFDVRIKNIFSSYLSRAICHFARASVLSDVDGAFAAVDIVSNDACGEYCFMNQIV